MRSPKRRRPLPRRLCEAPPEEVDLSALAEAARYVGSPEHKTYPSVAGPPRPRADASKCDKALDGKEEDPTAWLQQAIRKGMVGFPWEGRFPRYVWYHDYDGDVVYEARLVNRGNGEYKGYPLLREEWPKGI